MEISFWQSILDRLFTPVFQGVSFIIGLTYALLIAWGGFVLAVLIILTMLREKRKPSNIFAWSFAVLIFPYIGVPLYFLVGGRKSQRLVRKKSAFMERALQVSGFTDLASFSQSVKEGNRCQLLGDGCSALDTLLQQIHRANESIEVMTYILSNDATGNAIVDALAERATAGVQVRLLIDSFGSLTNRGSALRRLVKAGGELARFMPLLPLHSHHSANLRNHRKLALFDGQTAITGGQNLDLRFMATACHPDLFTDFSLLIEGPAVQALTFAFFSDWAYATKTAPDHFSNFFATRPAACGNSSIEVIESGPEIKEDPLYEAILAAVQECREEMTLVTPYFVPDEVLLRSLLVKAHLGRRIRIYLPRRSNHRIVDLARYQFVRQLHQAGVEILLYLPGMLHAKLLLVDGHTAITGSANFDMRSLFVNFELGLIHRSTSDVRMLQAWVAQLNRDCTRFETEFAAMPHMGRRIAEDFAHMISPLL